ncbi:MAG: molybdopterin-binding protein [Burkholderiales bacterium]|nr:molybdopterin-binding protein [Burkholderiales bacterium]
MNRPFRLRRRNARRRFLAATAAAASALALSGCDNLSRSTWFPRILDAAEPLNKAVAKLIGRRAVAQEFAESDLSPEFRSNGTADPGTAQYNAWVANGFADYRLAVGGLVEAPRALSLAELRALPARTQITRHDCVEGWSAIGKWKGVPFAALMELVRPKMDARYVVLHCADPMASDDTDLYYESIDLDDARHPQTILAYDLNGAPLPVPNGAPIRLRVERQLGYKHAKFVTAIEFVASFAHIAGGRGGYWEDQGYQWWAGI